jgi:hypothetical protein
MERVTGIGGLFFRSKDPKALQDWYQAYLGVAAPPPDYDQKPWWQEAGPTVFAPFEETTEYFGPSEQTWMVNFRVHDLDDKKEIQTFNHPAEGQMGPMRFSADRQTLYFGGQHGQLYRWDLKNNKLTKGAKAPRRRKQDDANRQRPQSRCRTQIDESRSTHWGCPSPPRAISSNVLPGVSCLPAKPG